MKKKINFVVTNSLYFIFDFITISLSILSSYYLYRFLRIGKQVYYAPNEIIPISFLIAFASILILFAFGAYKIESSLLNVQEIKKVIKGITFSFMVFSVIVVIIKMSPSRYVLILSYIISLIFLVSERSLLYHLLPLFPLSRNTQRKVLIYGAGELGKALYQYIVNSPKLGIRPLGFIDDDKSKKGMVVSRSGFNCNDGISVLGNGEDIKKLKKKLGVEEIFIAISNIKRERLMNILNSLRCLDLKVFIVPYLYKIFIRKIQIDKIGDIPIIREEDEKEYSNLYLYIKRYFDFCISLFLLILLFPFFILMAFFIKIDSKGPVLFRQDRVGKDGKIFKMYKFRSMFKNTEAYAVNPISNKDKRITKAGRILRKTSLDELPQLINVLKGDMSIVGPRPEMPFIVEQYNKFHKERLKVKPGITGLWQLSGDRDKPIHENMEYDLYYIRNMSFFLDIAILIETLIFAFKGI